MVPCVTAGVRVHASSSVHDGRRKTGEGQRRRRTRSQPTRPGKRKCLRDVSIWHRLHDLSGRSNLDRLIWIKETPPEMQDTGLALRSVTCGAGGIDMTVPASDPSSSSRNRWEAGAWLIAVVFALLATFLFADPWPYERPYPIAEAVPLWVVDTAPVRSPTLRPVVTIAGYTYRCSECHDLFPSPLETDRTLTQHRDISLQHGINNRCFNCHNRTSRDAFASDDGSPIPFDQPQLLCAKCHGPVFRDWTHGVHGRTNGYWDTSRGLLDRKKCIQCHDPHAPAFAAMRPAPGPATLRMGNPQLDKPHRATNRNPLLIYERPEESAGPNMGEGH